MRAEGRGPICAECPFLISVENIFAKKSPRLKIKRPDPSIVNSSAINF